MCVSSIAALAVRYSEELKTSTDSVTMAIEELQQCVLNGNSELFYSVRIYFTWRNIIIFIFRFDQE